MTVGWRAHLDTAAEIAARHAVEVDAASRFPAEAIAALRAGGLLGMPVPSALGGPGLRLRDVASACKVLGERCGATGMIFAMHHIQLACIVDHHGDSGWCRRVLEGMATAPLLLGSVTSEVGVGGDIRRSLAAVTVEDGRFRLEKHGSTVSYGAASDGLLITARAAADAAETDQVLVVALRGDCVLERTGEWDALGMRGTCSEPFRVRAEGLQEQILPRPFADIIADTMLPVSHILWSSVWFGIAADAVSRLRALLREEWRKAGGLPRRAAALPALMSDMLTLQARLSAAVDRYEAARAASPSSMPMSLATDLSLLKNTMSEGCCDVALRAMRAAGFAGYCNGTPFSLGRHVRDLQSAPLMINNLRYSDSMANAALQGRPRFDIG